MAVSILTRWLQPIAARSLRLRSCQPLVLSASYSIDEQLSKQEYWKHRYSQTSTDLSFDWFLESREILDFLLDSMQHCHPGSKQPASCVDLGCGTSSVPRGILASSPVAISLVLLDFVHEALVYQKQHMNTAAAAAPESRCHFLCADVTCLPFADRSFNMAMDKGTMDALLKDRIKGYTKAVAMMSEVKRILTPGGRFVQISDEDPDTRLTFLDNLSRKCCHVRDCHVSDQQTAVVPACTKPSLDSHCPPASMENSTSNTGSVDNSISNMGSLYRPVDNSTSNMGSLYRPLDNSTSNMGSLYRPVDNSISNMGSLYRPLDNSTSNMGSLYRPVDNSTSNMGSLYRPVDNSTSNMGSLYRPVDNSTSNMGSTSTSSVCGSLFSPWSFTVVPSRWEKEYFIYWEDKLV